MFKMEGMGRKMNRPKLCNNWNDGLVSHDGDYKDYIDELEKYCDHLEMALDKACKVIESYSTTFYLKDNRLEFRCSSKEKWKEWALKDE